MQFKSLFLITSAISSVFATATVSELIDGVSDIESKLAVLENCISIFPHTDGTFQQAFDVHNSVDAIVDAVKATVTTAEGFEGPVSSIDGKEILDYFHGMLPLVESGLNALVKKRDALLALGIARAQSIISLDLQILRKAVVDLEIGLIAITPPECIDEAKSIVTTVKASLDTSISVFATL